VLVTKYFIYVGSALTALLFIAALCLPEPPALFADHTQTDKTIIRIKSTHKWPAKVVLDTSLPAILPPAGEVSQIAQPTARSADDWKNFGVFAALKSVEQTEDRRPTARAKHTRARVGRSNRLTDFPSAKEVKLEASNGCCRHERTGRRPSSGGMSRKRPVRTYGIPYNPVRQLNRPLWAVFRRAPSP
jgi:hypothetical protein